MTQVNYSVLVVEHYNASRGNGPYITQAPLEKRVSVDPGCLVLIYLYPLDSSNPNRKEKVWVRITKREEGHEGEGGHLGYVYYSGTLESTPFSEQLPAKGSQINFTHSSILEISPCQVT